MNNSQPIVPTTATTLRASETTGETYQFASRSGVALIL